MKTLHMILVSSLLASSVQPTLKADSLLKNSLTVIGAADILLAAAMGGFVLAKWLASDPLILADRDLIEKTTNALSSYKHNENLFFAKIHLALKSNHFETYKNVFFFNKDTNPIFLPQINHILSETMSLFDQYIATIENRMNLQRSNPRFKKLKETSSRLEQILNEMYEAKKRCHTYYSVISEIE